MHAAHDEVSSPRNRMMEPWRAKGGGVRALCSSRARVLELTKLGVIQLQSSYLNQKKTPFTDQGLLFFS